MHESMKEEEKKKIAKDKKWRQRIYGSRRLLKNHIRSMERRLAVEIGSLRGSNTFTKMNYYPINGAMEWFITWKVKISNLPEIMWCDGVEDLQLSIEGKLVKISAKLRIGPESDVRKIYPSQVNGVLYFDRNKKNFKRYKIDIDYGEKVYVLQKI